MRRLRILLIVSTALAVHLGGAPAHAGRTDFGWLYDSEVVPERGVELENWLVEENGKGDSDIHETQLWWGPVVGVTDRLELALPVEFGWERSLDQPQAKTQITRFGGELRWRLVDPDPIQAPPLVPLIRVGVKRIVAQRDRVRGESDFVLGLDEGLVHAAVDLGLIVESGGKEDSDVEGRPGAGASVEITRELRLGVEAYGEFRLNSGPSNDWFAVGPDLSWTHGRFWVTGTYPIGLSGIDSAPRVRWAVAF